MDGDRRGDEMFEGLDENISVLNDEHDREYDWSNATSEFEMGVDERGCGCGSGGR